MNSSMHVQETEVSTQGKAKNERETAAPSEQAQLTDRAEKTPNRPDYAVRGEKSSL